MGFPHTPKALPSAKQKAKRLADWFASKALVPILQLRRNEGVFSWEKLFHATRNAPIFKLEKELSINGKDVDDAGTGEQVCHGLILQKLGRKQTTGRNVSLFKSRLTTHKRDRLADIGIYF